MGERHESAEAPSDGPVGEPWWVNHANHMKGFEAFGVTGSPPTVRRLGTVTFGPKHKGPATTEERPGTVPFGPGEVRLGVACIQFSTHGDYTDGAFLYVCGTRREDVEARWYLADAEWKRLAGVLWPTRRTEAADA